MNGTPQGVTINGYLNGMTTFTARQNQTFSHVNVKGTGGAVLNPFYRVAIMSGMLMTVFLDGFNIMDNLSIKTPSQGVDTVSMERYVGAHVMAVYGFREISYFNAQNVMFRHDIYLMVDDGLGSLGMTRITNMPNGQFDDAFITHIF
jgi:hypothetical protein